MDTNALVEAIGQIALNVKNTPESKEFYVGVLGLRFLFDAGPSLAFLDAHGIRIMLAAEGSETAGKPNATLYFRVRDLDQAYRTATAKGAVGADAPHLIAKMDDHDLWMAFLRDPDGNLVGLMEERKPLD